MLQMLLAMIRNINIYVYLGPCQKSILELITSELSLEVPLLQNINEKYDLSGFCGCNQFL